MSIKRIQIDPAYSFHDEAGNSIDPQLFKLLGAIHREGKLTKAAKEVGISYRHAWNLLKKWGQFFGVEVVTLEKGRGAQLTSLGEKLLWAERRVMARLKPQMDNLASEINKELRRALADANPTLKLHASHGYAVALLPDFAETFQLDVQYQSPLDALASLNNGACDVAGFHLPTSVHIPELIASYERLIKPQAHVAIRFIKRQQGLMVKKGNPNNIEGVLDLARPELNFINRQPDSGTRTLLDKLIYNADLKPEQIPGYNQQEFTHGAIAAYVAAGMADVGFGVEAAARQFGLDFIPLAAEDYVMLCHRNTLKSSAMERFIQLLVSEKFKAATAELPGYCSEGCGEVLSLSHLEALR